MVYHRVWVVLTRGKRDLARISAFESSTAFVVAYRFNYKRVASGFARAESSAVLLENRRVKRTDFDNYTGSSLLMRLGMHRANLSFPIFTAFLSSLVAESNELG